MLELPSHPSPMVRFAGLTKIYPDGTQALQDVDLDVPHGQFCVILGPSGSGKSTLLRSLNGLVEPTRGEVWLGGRKIERGCYAEVRRKVGMIHQSFNLAPRLSVLTNACSGAVSALPIWRIVCKAFPLCLQRDACRLLDRVGLEEKQIHRRASELSGGQQQRVGIARAFVIDPAVILADEPVASLDPNTSAEILQLLREASRERGTTVLCSLHQIELARRFADRIVGISAGEVVFDGPPETLSDKALLRIYGAPEAVRAACDGTAPLGTESVGSDQPQLVGSC